MSLMCTKPETGRRSTLISPLPSLSASNTYTLQMPFHLLPLTHMFYIECPFQPKGLDVCALPDLQSSNYWRRKTYATSFGNLRDDITGLENEK